MTLYLKEKNNYLRKPEAIFICSYVRNLKRYVNLFNINKNGRYTLYIKYKR